MFYFRQLRARISPLGQIWTAATTHAKIHRRKLDKLNIIKSCEEILNPSVPMALRLSGILMDAITRLRVDMNEAWKSNKLMLLKDRTNEPHGTGDETHQSAVHKSDERELVPYFENATRPFLHGSELGISGLVFKEKGDVDAIINVDAGRTQRLLNQFAFPIAGIMKDLKNKRMIAAMMMFENSMEKEEMALQEHIRHIATCRKMIRAYSRLSSMYCDPVDFLELMHSIIQRLSSVKGKKKCIETLHALEMWRERRHTKGVLDISLDLIQEVKKIVWNRYKKGKNIQDVPEAEIEAIYLGVTLVVPTDDLNVIVLRNDNLHAILKCKREMDPRDKQKETLEKIWDIVDHAKFEVRFEHVDNEENWMAHG